MPPSGTQFVTTKLVLPCIDAVLELVGDRMEFFNLNKVLQTAVKVGEPDIVAVVLRRTSPLALIEEMEAKEAGTFNMALGYTSSSYAVLKGNKY